MPEVLTRVERRKEKTRNALLQVALALFYEKGIYWTTIEDITERADIGKGTFYKYFQTKEDLLQALLRQGLEALLTRIRDHIRGVTAGPSTIHGVIRTELAFYLENPQYLLLFHQVKGLLQLKVEAVKGLKDVYDWYFNSLGKLIRPPERKRSLQCVSPQHLAMAVSAFTSGLLTSYLVFGKDGEFQRSRDEIQRQLERSIDALISG